MPSGSLAGIYWTSDTLPKLKVKPVWNFTDWLDMWKKVSLAHEKKVYLITDDSVSS